MKIAVSPATRRAASVSSKFKVPSSKLLRIVVLLETAVRIHHQEGNHEFEL